MRFHALATDYDGTLATHGKVEDSTLAALERLRKSGRRTIMVTGRELPDLRKVFDRFDLFDCVVAENGALLYWPQTNEEEPLAPPPPVPFVEALQKKGVHPLSVGRVIVATWHPNENIVLDTIREQGLELQVIFNKGAVMVLPSGFNKARGLDEALKRMKLSPHNVVAVGDAENDMAMICDAEIGAAVENALPSVKDAADIVLKKDHGPGVEELIARIVHDDLASVRARQTRDITIAHGIDKQSFSFPAYGGSILLAGTSGGGKSTFATAFIEALTEAKYQFCVIDPEGDYEVLEGAVVLGTAKRAPEMEEVMNVLADPARNVVINLLGVGLNDRPAFFHSLLPQFEELRRRHGRPHWLVVDEAHHLLPKDRPAPEKFPEALFITVHPKSLAQNVRDTITHSLAVGQKPYETLGLDGDLAKLEPGHALAWRVGDEAGPREVKVDPPKGERRRHKRKYAAGELGEDKSFYFRGPEGKLKLRAQNLMLFLQMGEGVDDDTWEYHFARGDFSKWFRESIKDELLAEDAEKIESAHPKLEEARQGIREAVERHYTAPAD